MKKAYVIYHSKEKVRPFKPITDMIMSRILYNHRWLAAKLLIRRDVDGDCVSERTRGNTCDTVWDNAFDKVRPCK